MRLQNKILITVASLFFLVYCVVFIPAGSHAIRVHDTFDGNFSTRHVLIQSGHLFDFSGTSLVPGIMNELPRGVFPGPTDLPALLMYLFGSLNGIALTFILVRLTGALGMFLLCRDHAGIRKDEYGLLAMFCCAFACLPVFIIQGLTVTGVPLLLWAFFNLIKKDRRSSSFFIFVMFALWSQLVLVGVHAIVVLGALVIYFSIRNRIIPWLAVAGISLLAVTYLLSNWPMISLHLFSNGYESSRAAFVKEPGLNLKGVAGTFMINFFTNDYSAAAYAGYLFLPVLILGLFVVRKRADENKNFLKLITTILFICCFAVAFLDWKGLEGLYRSVPAANAFNMKRFTNLVPALFFTGIAVLSVQLVKVWKWSVMLISVTLAVLLVFIWRGTISYNNSGFETTGKTICREYETTFDEFFDQQTLGAVKQELGNDTLTNIVHFGILSSASKYAGLKVLDDYQGDYPKSYKLQFRKVIEGELKKSERLRKYFDEWGSRCYLESVAHFEDKVQLRNGIKYEPHLAINTSELLQMNCHNILSAIMIGNADSLKIRLKKVIVSPLSKRTYFLYRILSENSGEVVACLVNTN